MSDALEDETMLHHGSLRDASEAIRLSDLEWESWRGEGFDTTLSLKPGQSNMILTYPGEGSGVAVNRMRRIAALHEQETGEALCVRCDSDFAMLLHGMRRVTPGRLSVIIGLSIGQGIPWAWSDVNSYQLAVRIVSYLEARKFGRFVVFDAEDDHTWVRRTA